MCFCCGVAEMLAFAAGLKIVAICRKKKCKCDRPHEEPENGKNIQMPKTIVVEQGKGSDSPTM